MVTGMDARLYRLGRGCVKHRKLVLLIWVVGLVGLVAVGKSTGVHYRDNFSVKGVDSQNAADLLEKRFPAAAGASAQVVVHTPSGSLKDPKNLAAIAATEAALKQQPNVDSVIGPTLDPQLISPSGTVGLINVSYEQGITDLPKSSINDLYAATQPAKAAGLEVEYGGQVPTTLIVPKAPPSDAIGLIAAVIILLLAFGSVIAMGLPIGTALLGVGTGIAVIELLSSWITFPSVTPEIALMIGLGVGIDYSLFIVTRHRIALHHGLTVADAAGRAIATSGQAVLVAGTTVVIAIFGLAVAGVTALTFMGMGAAIVVAIMVAAALTLMPALLGFAGHNIDRFARSRNDPQA